MSLLYVCDGCDVRAPSVNGLPPDRWSAHHVYTKADGNQTLDSCPKPECRDAVRAMDRAPELLLPF